jgi:hypothetical protein
MQTLREPRPHTDVGTAGGREGAGQIPPWARLTAVAQGFGNLADPAFAFVVRGMGSQKFITRVWQTVKESRAYHRVISRTKGDFRAHGISLEFKITRIRPGAHLSTQILCGAHSSGIRARRLRQRTGNQSTGKGRFFAFGNMIGNVMRGFVAHDKRDFIGIARVRNQGQRKANNRPPPAIDRLKRVGGHIGPAVHHNLQIAVDPKARAFAAHRFGDGFNLCDDGQKGGHGLLWRAAINGRQIAWLCAHCAFFQHRWQACRHATGHSKARNHQKNKFHGGLLRQRCFDLTNPLPCASPDHVKFTLSCTAARPSIVNMFTIEHEFDATVITLVDDGPGYLQEDVTIAAFEDCITLEQVDPLSGAPVRLTLSMAQVADLAAALDLPEGSYRLTKAVS